MTEHCTYTKTNSDSYSTHWKTECGSTVVCSAPIEVGFSLDPLPNEDGKFCHYCGKEITLLCFKKNSVSR